ncbi:MAG: dephospho-CoA kinase [Deltaproteobacteria bacterium]|nr:dephospho-CoA kinase [Deltaproteobacteria bacterium]
MLVLGLTGGIASGKSTVAKHLAQRGARVIDADKLGHRAYEPGTQAHREVIAAFGPEVRAADGTIDRAALGARVFGKPAELKRLTDIVWPEIRRLAEKEIAAIRASDARAVVVLEAAVLFEAGWEPLVDEIWVAVVERAVAVARAVARGGLSAAQVEARIDSQLGNGERKKRAHVVLDNSGDEAALVLQLDAQWPRVAEAARARA